mmetsp:Transcript_20703/g.33027  ORF Transcript_20703/g.33027 Transcript_20703/m.33027 type:complete len:207 (+) Transcript_20703:372-992(+)
MVNLEIDVHFLAVLILEYHGASPGRSALVSAVERQAAKEEDARRNHDAYARVQLGVAVSHAILVRLSSNRASPTEWASRVVLAFLDCYWPTTRCRITLEVVVRAAGDISVLFALSTGGRACAPASQNPDGGWHHEIADELGWVHADVCRAHALRNEDSCSLKSLGQGIDKLLIESSGRITETYELCFDGGGVIAGFDSNDKIHGDS